ncbi:hypothetical protein BDF22DRAFT_683030 [Syncephalis plumigaleata]|nr:hypothetical protein BDF22DRAFT_683030 [Syncephalis plumigaleata]
MKFAKQLKSAQQAEWRGHYVDYKLLKQKLHGFIKTPTDTASRKDVEATCDEQSDATTVATPPALTITQLEELDDTFFMVLRNQADKCESFYLHLLGQLRSQQQRVFFEDYQKHAYGSATSSVSPSISPLASPLFGQTTAILGGPSPTESIPSTAATTTTTTTTATITPASASLMATTPGATSPQLTPDAVVAFGQRVVTYAELNKLAIQKILKKHRKRFDAALLTVQSANAQLLNEVRERSLAVEKGILDTLKRSRAFWTRQELETALDEIKAFRWQHVKEQAHLLKCAIP